MLQPVAALAFADDGDDRPDADAGLTAASALAVRAPDTEAEESTSVSLIPPSCTSDAPVIKMFRHPKFYSNT